MMTMQCKMKPAMKDIKISYKESKPVQYRMVSDTARKPLFSTDSIPIVKEDRMRIKRELPLSTTPIPAFESWVPEPVLRPEYGTLYHHQGFLMPGLRRTYLFVVVDIPSVANLIHSPPQFPRCSDWANRNLEYWQNTHVDIPEIQELIHQDVCREHSEAYKQMLKTIEGRRTNITYKIENVLPALLPNGIVNTPNGKAIELPGGQMWTADMENRKKRAIPLAAVPAIFAGVQAVGGLLIKGINAVASYKRSKAMAGAMKSLYKNDQILHNRLISIENKTAILAQAQLTGFDIMDNRMRDIDAKWQYAENTLQRMMNATTEEFRRTHETINNHHLAIKFQSLATNQQLRIMRLYLGFYDTYERILDHFLAGLDALGTGRLTYQLLDPVDLQRYLRSIEYHFKQDRLGIELAFDHTYQYYAEPMVTFTNTATKLMIQIPIYIKSEFQVPMSVFSTEVAPVPYDAETYSGEQSQYTLVDIEFPYMATTPDNYIPLTEQQLRLCWKIGYTYYCENSYLLRHRSQHTCASAIYYNEDETAKVEHCKPQFIQNKKFNAQILDAGKQLVLSNLPKPWVLVCGPDHRPFPIEYSTYRVINRTELCECALSAGPYYLSPTLVNCNDNEEVKPNGKFETNFVFNKIIFDVLKTRFDIQPGIEISAKLDKFLDAIPQYNFDPLNWYKGMGKQTSVIAYQDSEVWTQLIEVLQYVVWDSQEQVYRNQYEWKFAQEDFQTFMAQANYWQKAELICAFLAPIALLLIVALFIAHRRMVYAAILSSKILDEYEIVKTIQTTSAKSIETPRPLIFTIPPQLDELTENDSVPEEKMVVSITAITITITILAILFMIWRKFRYASSMARVCFPLYPLSKIIRGTARTDIFVEITDITTSETMWAHFATVAVHPSLLYVTGKLNTPDIRIMHVCCCKVMQIDWKNVLITDSKRKVIQLPQRGSVSIWTTQELKTVDTTRQYSIKILGRVLDQIMILKETKHGPPGQARASTILADAPMYY